MLQNKTLATFKYRERAKKKSLWTRGSDKYLSITYFESLNENMAIVKVINIIFQRNYRKKRKEYTPWKIMYVINILPFKQTSNR